MKRLLLFATALSLVACSPVTTTPAGTTPPPSRGDAILVVADSAAAVADALKVAPPATLTKTTIDEKAIRLAFKEFDRALTVIDSFVAGGKIVRNSPVAMTIRKGVLTTATALNAASAAQRAGNATSYTAALRDAKNALAMVQTAIALGN